MIYLFDENEKLIRIVSRKSIKTAEQKFSLADRYVSDRLEIEMKAMLDTELEKVEYMAIQSINNRHKFHFFYVLQKETEGFITSLTGVQSGIEELRKTPVYEKRPRAMQARPVIEDLLKDTNWIPRYIATTKFKNTMFYYTSVFESLKKACEVWDLEMQFIVEMNGNQIGARYIDFKKKIGKAVGKRVVYGHNALTIIQEVERTELYTALIGRGKGEEVSSAEENESGKAGYGRKINFEEIVWRKSEGKPVDKPAGQRYVEIPEMTKRYGIRQADGTMKPKIGFIEFGEEEDRELLLEQTYEALVTASRPAVTFKTTTAYLKDVEIGDTVRVIRHDRNLYYETRVFEITFNRLNNTSADIKLGDKVSGGSTSSTIQSAVEKAIEDWVVEDFNKFVEKLPDFLPSSDGFNQNWYSEEDPTVTHPKKVMIGDIWFKPDPEHEGHKIMLRWTGEMWEEILRTYNAERLKEQIEAEMAEVNASMKGLDDELKSKVAELLAKAGLAESAADEAKRLAEKANADLTKERERSNSAIQGALAEARRLDQEERRATETAILAARNKANDDAHRLISLSERALQESINDLSTEVTKTNDAIKLKADKSTVDNLTGKVSQAEASLRVQSGEIASRVKTSDFDKEKEKLRTAETNIRQLGDRITTEISRTEAKIDNFKVGSRNYAEDYDFSRGLWEYSQGDNSQTTQGATDGVYTMTTTAATWHQWQIHSESGARLGGKLDSTALTELKTGETYTLSFEAKVNSGSPDIWFELRDNGKANYDNLVIHLNKSVRLTNDWSRYSVTGVLKPNSDFGHRRIILGYNAIGSVSFRKVELTQSSIFTDAGPAPEDTQSEIESVKTTVTTTAEGVQQVSDRIARNREVFSRLNTQINQLVGDVSSKVSQTEYDNLKRTVEGQATDVRQTKEAIALKADKTLVTTVQTAATEAKNLANSANSKADSATVKATQADSKATSANTKADQASTKADSAVSTANQANQKATSADNKATNAATKAEDAAKKSAEAMTKSVDALAKAGLVDAKATDALAKAIQNSQSISRAQAELQVANEAINTKVSKVDFDLANRKLATAETQITTIAGQISEKLSRTEVNSLVDGKGFITNSTFTNAIDKTERGMIARIAQVETKIPTEIGSRNYIRGSLQMRKGSGDWSDNSFRHSGPGSSTAIDISDFPTKDISKAIKLAGQGAGIAQDNFEISEGVWTVSYWVKGAVGTVVQLQAYWSSSNYLSGASQGITLETPEWKRISFKAQNRMAGKVSIGYIYLRSGTEVLVTAPKLEKGDVLTDHSPAPEDFATTIALHEVRDTVDGHTRTLTAQGRSISQAVHTAEGLFSRVSSVEQNSNRLDNRMNFVEGAANAATTQVSQLAGSWAVRNLTDSGTVLNQLNLNRDGSVKIDGSLVQITGKTYIQDGVISSAKIGNLDAGKITTGTLNAAKINLINLDASKITTGSMEARFIRGGQLTSLNGATMFDLQSGTLNFQQNSPSIRRLQNGYGNQFLKFETGQFTFDGRRGYNTNKTLLGSTRGNAENAETNDFTGFRIWNGHAGGQAADMIDVIADKIVFQDAANDVGRSPWILETAGGNVHFYGENQNGKKHILGTGTRKFHESHIVSGYFDELYLIGAGGYVRVAQALKDLALKIGYTGNDGWANRIG